jgi:hypothetical protein
VRIKDHCIRGGDGKGTVDGGRSLFFAEATQVMRVPSCQKQMVSMARSF